MTEDNAGVIKIDKEKDSLGKQEIFTKFFECPNCKYEFIMADNNYCADCGSKLEFI